MTSIGAVFTFELEQRVTIRVSGETGVIQARSESINHVNQYQVHYKAADGRACTYWFDEQDLVFAEPATSKVEEAEGLDY